MTNSLIYMTFFYEWKYFITLNKLNPNSQLSQILPIGNNQEKKIKDLN